MPSPEQFWNERRRLKGDQLADLQRKFEARLRYDKITSGTRVNLDLILNLARGLTTDLLVFNLGCGDGEKAIEEARILAPLGFVVHAVDINKSGIANGRRSALEQGVGNIIFEEKDVVIPDRKYFRSAGLSLVEALLCNLIGTDAEVAIGNISQLTAMGGYVVVADCLVATDEGVVATMLEAGYPLGQIQLWQDDWKERYKNNAIAMDLGDKAYTFIVMPPERDKQKLEHASPDELRRLLVKGNIERLARHWRRQELIELFERSGMRLFNWENTVWRSRAGEPIAGMVAVFQKQEVRGIDTEVLAIPTMATMLGFAS